MILKGLSVAVITSQPIHLPSFRLFRTLKSRVLYFIFSPAVPRRNLDIILGITLMYSWITKSLLWKQLLSQFWLYFRLLELEFSWELAPQDIRTDKFVKTDIVFTPTTTTITIMVLPVWAKLMLLTFENCVWNLAWNLSCLFTCEYFGSFHSSTKHEWLFYCNSALFESWVRYSLLS